MTIIISIASLFVLFLLSKHFSKKSKARLELSRNNFVKQVKREWNLVKIKTSDCQIIKFDALVDEKLIEKENENFFEWISKDPNHENLITEKRSKLICNLIRNNQIEKKFVKIILMDHTVLEFKVKMQDYINVYVMKDFEEGNYYIDLGFLDDPIK